MKKSKGIYWQISQEKGFGDSLEEGLYAFERRYPGTSPNICFAHPSWLEGKSKIHHEYRGLTFTIFPSESKRHDRLWIGFIPESTLSKKKAMSKEHNKVNFLFIAFISVLGHAAFQIFCGLLSFTFLDKVLVDSSLGYFWASSIAFALSAGSVLPSFLKVAISYLEQSEEVTDLPYVLTSFFLITSVYSGVINAYLAAIGISREMNNIGFLGLLGITIFLGGIHILFFLITLFLLFKNKPTRSL